MDSLPAELIGATKLLSEVEVDVMNLAVNGLEESTVEGFRRVLTCVVERLEKAQEERQYEELAAEYEAKWADKVQDVDRRVEE